mmetsp:Transcript_91046/g.236045  ORF Transcript_91046/g.236045 Transcript_91046/m.236045 type:complete len:217 (+) Transcript_91046:520-1170(+)
MDTQDRVIRLDDRSCNLRASPNCETQLRLFAVVHTQALQHEAAEAGPGTAAASVVDHEALEARAIVCELANAVQHEIHNLLADGVVPASKVVCGILLTRDQLLRVEELAVCARAHLIDHRGLKVHEDTTRHVFSCARFGEEGVERVVAATDGLVTRHLSVGLDAVLQAEELPASITDLDACLADVDADSLTHCFFREGFTRVVEGGRERGSRLESK